MHPEIMPAFNQIRNAVLGKENAIKRCLTCLLAGGHLLIEDLPGIGKTTLAKATARTLGLSFRRIQCTSDMLPGDILGVSIFDAKERLFRFHPGPVFTQILLSDEINRAGPKTQSALLEAMEENQVSVEGETHPLPHPFFLMATQNPWEQAGAHPLPESQLDRFLMRISMGYPDRDAEKRILMGESRQSLPGLIPLLSAEKIITFQKKVRQIRISGAMLDYIQDILEHTRSHPLFLAGLSPRAGMALVQTSRAWAFLHDRDFCLPEDLQAVFPWVASHRLQKARDFSGYTPEEMKQMLKEIPLP
ncbi:MoxR family ATPase [Desulfobotulus sp. H1]|uniref:MoxR family ATPase n=1 Tax=Desulfobotulus pelophilus TaxID=2823377 RepID=A0ABT3N9X4_9BACT|nr:MoxR family ATPase [Desulfobotulus pelophilus]MCW7754259.1 MoxR family ATPase [Desulfobotulus pelophilus]